MVRLLAALVLLGGVGMTTGTASAADGCGRGFQWNGWRCAPYQRNYAPQFYAPHYAPPAVRYYAPRHSYQGRGCPPHYEWNPRYGKCTSNFR